MYRRNRSTRSGGIALPDDARSGEAHGDATGARRTLRAVAQLVRSRRRLAHVPTLMQVRALAHFDGREPCSYLLDPTVELRARAAARRRGPDSVGTRCASPVATPTAGGGSSW